MEKLRDKLAQRLRSLMDSTPTLNTQTKVSTKARVSQSTVQRILSRDVAATVDVVEDLGKAFGLRPPSLILSDEVEAEMLRVWHALNAEARSEVHRYAVSLSTKNQPVRPRLEFDIQLNQGSALTAANKRASSRSLQPVENNKSCLSTGQNILANTSNSTPKITPKITKQKTRTRSA